MSEWQPIETAPTGLPDGEPEDDPPRLLVWVADGGRDGKGTVDFGWVHIRKSGTRKVYASSYSLGNWSITHWMPLPAPPPYTEV